MLIVIDNYDSFTYNLVHYLLELKVEVEVFRNDKITLTQIERKNPSHILISPGPCSPKEAGISVGLIKKFGGKIPILGVCLGHQCIGAAYDIPIIRAHQVMHGKLSHINHDGSGIFKDIPNKFQATRYHSLVLSQDIIPSCLKVNAWAKYPDSDLTEIMGIEHRRKAIIGVQFHPESILSEHGHKMLQNFLNYAIQ